MQAGFIRLKTTKEFSMDEGSFVVHYTFKGNVRWIIAQLALYPIIDLSFKYLQWHCTIFQYRITKRVETQRVENIT
jgi:hypothetical protein